jgi:nucleoside-diphosphate-sugar epimerase
MPLTITGAQSELGRLLSPHKTRAKVHINLAGQQANTLLHDGHAWKDFARSARAGLQRAMRTDAGLLVHASCAFVLADPARDPLHSLAQTIVELEQQVLSGPVPAVVVRLGYLYGPTSRDLLAYRKAFGLGRPYWAGKRRAGQYHLHHDDAVSVLLAAAKKKYAGQTFYATGGTALPFMTFMDHFARGVGRRVPLHIPLIAEPLMKLIVRKEHVQQSALAMPVDVPMPQLPGWSAAWPDPCAALDQIIADWDTR